MNANEKRDDPLHERIRDEARASPEINDRLRREMADRTRVEEALRRSNEEFQAICNGMADGLVMVDLENQLPVQSNAALSCMLGYSAEEIRSLHPTAVHPPEDAGAAMDRYLAHAEGRTIRSDNVRFLRKDGSIFYADVTSCRSVFEGRLSLILFLRDVTERHAQAEHLQQETKALERLLQAVDHERKVIAYDIHDGLAQLIAAALMHFRAFDVRRHSEPETAEDTFRDAIKILEKSHVEVRRLIDGVRSPILDKHGLVAAVGHLVAEVQRASGKRIEFDCRVEFRRLESIEENAAYRIVQEGLANACQHSQSDKVLVQLIQQDDELHVSIRDWGIGFVPERIDGEHFGLGGIRERARILGGHATIESHPGGGTCVSVHVPVREREVDL